MAWGIRLGNWSLKGSKSENSVAIPGKTLLEWQFTNLACITITWKSAPHPGSPPTHLSQSKNLHSKHVPVRSSCCCSGTTLGELLIYKDIEIMEDHVRSRILTIRKSIKEPLSEYILSPIRETYGLEQWAWNFIVYHNYLGSLWKIRSPEKSQRF